MNVKNLTQKKIVVVFYYKKASYDIYDETLYSYTLHTDI
jgi:hypothetical protein